jgi:hypothetical protein
VLIKDWKQYNFAKDRKFDISQVSFVICMWIIAVAITAVFIQGCAKQPTDTIKQVCEDGYVYKIIEGSYKEIVRENGSFKRCESGEILIKEF